MRIGHWARIGSHRRNAKSRGRFRACQSRSFLCSKSAVSPTAFVLECGFSALLLRRSRGAFLPPWSRHHQRFLNRRYPPLAQLLLQGFRLLAGPALLVNAHQHLHRNRVRKIFFQVRHGLGIGALFARPCSVFSCGPFSLSPALALHPSRFLAGIDRTQTLPIALSFRRVCAIMLFLNEG